MKKMILAALIGATILTPAAASAQDRGGRERRGGEMREQRQQWQQQRQEQRTQRQEQRPERQQFQRPERAQLQPRPAQPVAAAPQVTPERREFRQERREDRREFRGERRDDRSGFREERREDRRDFRQGGTSPRDYRQDRREDRRDYRDDRRDDRRDYRNDRRDDRRDYRQDQRRYGDWRDQQQYRRGWDDNRNWNRSWRGDRRYNWNDYRASNRHVYRLPRYYAPRGYNYGYRRFSIGITIGSMLFAPDYWINDPFYYRLPPAYGPYRWVRYYNDALLVDVRSGYVVDVIHDIFW